jgi:uncharacterized membrane protein
MMVTTRAGLVARPDSPVSTDATVTHRRWRVTDRDVLVVLLSGVASLAIWNSARKSLWTDEAYSLHTAAMSLPGTVAQAIRFELQPPIYFAALHEWMRWGGGIDMARLFSTVCILGVIAIGWAIGRRLRLPWPPSLAVLLAITPGVIWAASEARSYPMAMLMAIGTLSCFLNLVTDPSPRPSAGRVVAYGAMAALSVGTFYYCGFLLLGQWIAALTTRRHAGRVTAALAGAALACAPIFPIALSQWRAHPLGAPAAPPGHPGVMGAAYTTIATITRAFLGDTPLLRLPHAVPIAVLALLAILVARALTQVVARGPRLDALERMLLVAAAVPVLCLAALMIANKIPVRPRYCLILIPVSLAATSVVWARIAVPRARRIAGAGLVVTLLVALTMYEWHGVTTEDWRSAAAYITAHETADDRVLVFDPDRLLPFQYYYHGPAPSAGLPVEPRLDRYAPDGYAIPDTAAVTRRFAAVGVHGRVWIVEADRLLPSLTASVRVIDDALARCCRIASHQAYPGLTIIEAYVR